MHQSKEVESAKKRKEEKTGEVIPQSPEVQIQNYLDRFQEIIDRENGQSRQDGIEAIKRFMRRRFVIQSEDIPESVFLLEQRIARQLGHGHVEITEEFKKRKIKEIIDNQVQSLDKWIDYLSSEDATYPDWAKYWAFRSVTEMGKLKRKEGKDGSITASFSKRKKDTASAFPPMNPRALALVVDTITKQVQEKQKPKKKRMPLKNISKKLDDAAFRQLTSTESFSKIYAQFLVELPEYSTEGLQEIRGEWVKYDQGSKPDTLVKSLEGYPLEWCTAGYDTAESQLQGGDFYVYYSLNEDGNAHVPRVAIRMEQERIAEVRGIAPNQEVDPYISPVIEEKMEEFGKEGEIYQKRSRDMKQLTDIEMRSQHQELTREDLRFLYEIDGQIEGFGYSGDPRIDELLEGRDRRLDIATVLQVSPEQISFSQEEAIAGDIVFHYGDLNFLRLTSAEGLTLPESVGGSLNLWRLTSAEGLTLPESVGGDLYLGGRAEGE